MAEIRMYEYYVIKFLNKTPNGILHTCVPRSWIIYCEETTILVAFPEEDPQLTLRRIVNGESKGMDWRTFKAVVLYGADNYVKGLFWMTYVDMTRYQPMSGNTSAKKNTGSKPSRQPTGKPLNEQSRTPIISLVDSDEDEEERPQKKVPTRRSNDPTLVVNVNLGNDTTKLSVAHPNSESHVLVHENTEKNSVTIFEKKESVTETLAILSDAINHLKEIPNMIKEIELCKSKLDEIIEFTASDSNKVTEETNGDKIINKTVKDKSDADKYVSKRKKDKHLKENDEVPTKKRKENLFGLLKRNRNLSLLTVKHTEPSPELEEIILNSQVYIDKVNFEYYTQTASDHKTLARNLMNEIFTEQALKLCTLFSSKLNTRPALDKHAVKVILKFVKLHGRCKNWSKYDSTSVINSLNIRLNNLRQKKRLKQIPAKIV